MGFKYTEYNREGLLKMEAEREPKHRRTLNSGGSPAAGDQAMRRRWRMRYMMPWGRRLV
jgi:hypothetical protein